MARQQQLTEKLNIHCFAGITLFGEQCASGRVLLRVLLGEGCLLQY